MPVYKYRRIEDMPDPAMMTAPWDPGIGGRMRAVCALGTALAGPRELPRGVRKYRSFEELNADREKWEDARIARIRAERLRK